MSSSPTRPFGLARTILLLLPTLLFPSLAGAATIEAYASSFTGDPLSVRIEIDDEREDGHLVITLSVDDDESIADLRGFFAQVSDESLLPGLSVTGDLITSSAFEANAVSNLGRGSNLNGGGTPCACDLGIEIGSPGAGKADIQSVTFTLSHATESLDVSFFAGEEFGVRATSVGSDKGGRNGSSKLVGVVPEPTTGVLMGLGLAVLARGRRRTRDAR